MTMRGKLTRDAPFLKGLERRLTLTNFDMEAAGRLLARKIKDRTAEHRDEDRRSFKDYTEPYARRKGVDPHAVDLKATGQMLRDLGVIKATSKSVTIGFGTARSRRVAGFVERTRRFMGVPAAWLKEVRDVILRRHHQK